MVEKELKKTSFPCACVFRSIEKFVRKSQAKFQSEKKLSISNKDKE